MSRVGLLLIAFLAFGNAGAKAQNCNCPSEFSFIKYYIEQNYAGFRDKVNSQTDKEYRNFTDAISKKIAVALGNGECIYLISKWLAWFRDGHVQVSMSDNTDISRMDPATVQQLIDQSEIIYIDKDRIRRLQQSKTLEGIYWNNDSSYKIALVQNKNQFRDYAGIILSAKNPYWKKNQVKLELRKSGDSLEGVMYFRNHYPDYVRYAIQQNQLGEWQREGSQKNGSRIERVNIDSKKIDDQTLYIKIGSFGESNAKNIDSVFKSYQDVLATVPNLIIDVRDNGGGSDFAYDPITPYLYTGPVKNIGVDALSTEANIITWNKILASPDIPENAKAYIRMRISIMEKNLGRNINIAPDEIDSSGTPLQYPKKIAIIINGGCASTTEQFLLLAKQSSKTILVGENTEGVLDYANMRDTSFSCMPYVLSYSTTRSRRIDIGQGIDNIGIAPDIHLAKNKDWIEETIKILKAAK